MPRVEHRKARKDYPEAGIKAGDMYYYTSIKMQRGGLVKRSLKPFKPSQLTLSPFRSGTLAAGEAWEEGDKDEQAMRDAAETLREIGTECQESFDNMPEGLQQGDTGQLIENRASELEGLADELEGLADELEGLEEPEEPSEEPFDPSDFAEDLSTMDPEDQAEFLSDKEQEHTEAQSDYDGEVAEFESEQSRIKDEADSLMGDMPE